MFQCQKISFCQIVCPSNDAIEDQNIKCNRNMTDENLLVSWQDFETSSPDVIRNLWNDEDFSDVTLATGDGRLFRAHRVILSSATTKLRSILRNPGKCENLFLYLPDVQSTIHIVQSVHWGFRGGQKLRYCNRID